MVGIKSLVEPTDPPIQPRFSAKNNNLLRASFLRATRSVTPPKKRPEEACVNQAAPNIQV